MRIKSGSRKQVFIKNGVVTFEDDYEELRIMHDIMYNYIPLVILDKSQLRLQKNLKMNDDEFWQSSELKLRYKRQRRVSNQVLTFINLARSYDLDQEDSIIKLDSILKYNPVLSEYYFALMSGLELIYFAKNFWSPNYFLDGAMMNFGKDENNEIYWFDPIIKV